MTLAFILWSRWHGFESSLTNSPGVRVDAVAAIEVTCDSSHGLWWDNPPYILHIGTIGSKDEKLEFCLSLMVSWQSIKALQRFNCEVPWKSHIVVAWIEVFNLKGCAVYLLKLDLWVGSMVKHLGVGLFNGQAFRGWSIRGGGLFH